MAIKLACECGKKLAFKDELAGKKVKCPACQKLLSIPKPQVTEDDWDLEDSAEEDFEDEPSDVQMKSRSEKSSASRGAVPRKSSVKGKNSQPSTRGLLIGVSAGGGLLVVALLAWMLWPVAPAANVAANPPMNQEQTSVPASGDTVKPGNSTGTAPNVPANAAAADAGSDLQALQGDWHIVDFQQDPPASPITSDGLKLATVTFSGDSMTFIYAESGGHKETLTIKLDVSQNPKTIDTTNADGRRKGQTNPGIYSLEGDVLKLHLSTSRPTSWTLIKERKSTVMVLNRGRPAAVTNAQPLEDKFDHKAWRRAQQSLVKLRIQSQLLTRREAPESIPEGLDAVAVLVLPDLSASDRYPDDIVSTIKSQSHVIVKTLEMNDAKLKQLSEHSGLIGLNMSGKSVISADGLSHLKQCSQFRHLYLEQVNLTPDLMKMIGEFSNLSSLSLNDMPVTDDLLSNLLPLKGLDTLSLQNTSVTDAGTAQLAKLSSLRVLFLDGSKLTDQGLASLKSLSKLTMFSVRRLTVSPQAVDEFQKALPGCKILK